LVIKLRAAAVVGPCCDAPKRPLHHAQLLSRAMATYSAPTHDMNFGIDKEYARARFIRRRRTRTHLSRRV